MIIFINCFVKDKKLYFQEINGNAKFMTPPSFDSLTPVSNVDKSFYNPFTVDISLDNANIPITGAYNVNTIQCWVVYIISNARWSHLADLTLLANDKVLFSLFSSRCFKIMSRHQCHQNLLKTEVKLYYYYTMLDIMYMFI